MRLESWHDLFQELLAKYAPVDLVLERARESTATKAIQVWMATRGHHPDEDDDIIPWCTDADDLLRLAVTWGLAECVRLLLDQIPPEKLADFWVAHPECSGGYPHMAAAGGHVHILQILRDHGMELDEADAYLYPRTPLAVAIITNQVEAVRYLLDVGAHTKSRIMGIHPDRGNWVQMRHWEFAALHCNLAVIKLLAAYGLDVPKRVENDGRDEDKDQYSNEEAEEVDSDVDETDDHNQMPLHLSLARGDLSHDTDIIRFIVDRTHKSVLSKYGGRLLARAINNNAPLDVIRLLIERGASLQDTKEFPYLCPLDAAVRRDDRELINLLVDLGAPCTNSSIHGVIKKGDEALLDLLLPRCEELDVKECALQGNVELVQKFLDHGADPDGVGRWHDLLEEVVARGHVGIVKLLLEAGADVRKREPLDLAADQGSVELVRLLLEYGMDANAERGRFPHPLMPPLMLAAWNGHPEVMQILLEHGADAAYKHKDRMTAWEAAKDGQHDAVREVLEKHLRERGLPIE
jgi:ankyrin repeat protein